MIRPAATLLSTILRLKCVLAASLVPDNEKEVRVFTSVPGWIGNERTAAELNVGVHLGDSKWPRDTILATLCSAGQKERSAASCHPGRGAYQRTEVDIAPACVTDRAKLWRGV